MGVFEGARVIVMVGVMVRVNVAVGEKSAPGKVFVGCSKVGGIVGVEAETGEFWGATLVKAARVDATFVATMSGLVTP